MNTKQYKKLLGLIKSVAENGINYCEEFTAHDFKFVEREILDILAVPKVASITTSSSRCCGFKKNGKRCKRKVGSFCDKHEYQEILISQIMVDEIPNGMKSVPTEESHLPKEVKNDDEVAKCQHESYSNGYYQTGKLCGLPTTGGNKLCNEHMM